MKFNSQCIASLAAMMLLGTPAVAEIAVEAESLLTTWESSRVTEPTVVIDEEIRTVELLFARSLDRPIDSKTAQQWTDLGFTIESLRLGDDTCHLLFERSDAHRGRGMFLLCPTREHSSMLLVPHGFHDRFTAEIGILFATEGRFRIVAWNTTPRRAIEDHESDPESSEEAQALESYFTALVRAASVLGLPGPMIQLHGFASYRRSTEAGRTARAILSSGTNSPHRSTLEIAACLEGRLGEGLLVYPTEVNELGGTHNRVAAVLRDWGRNDFLHLELSFALRKRLLQDVRTRRSLIECIGGSSR